MADSVPGLPGKRGLASVARVMRTLSARILLGFAALTIAFGVITGTDIRNMWAVENEAKLVRAGYMLLAFSSRDLARREEDYRTYLSDALQDDPNPIAARINLQRTKTNRDNALARTREILDKLSHSTEFGARQFAPTRVRVDAIDRAIVEISPLYLAVYAFPPLGREDVPGTEMARYALSRLRDSERRTATMANVLAEDLERNVRMRMSHLEGNEHLLRIITIYLGVAALLLALLITIWVVITLRPLRRLRDGARRVAAADYASRIDERGPSEVLDLAREFNSMARAVEERERELVRQERLAAVGKMAAMITHEVRNPLSSIGLNTELLEEELASGSDEARKLCASIHHEVDRLTAITEDYLAFARLPKPKIAREPVNELVGALASFVREDLAARQVTLDVQPGESDPVAMCDAAQLRQCLINLVRNAADAVAGKGKGTVTLRTARIGVRVLISVEDDGVGIAAEDLPRLFDPFFSTKEGGSGLGLALTQQIVKDHGGELTVESAVGRGTTFTVSVPAAP